MSLSPHDLRATVLTVPAWGFGRTRAKVDRLIRDGMVPTSVVLRVLSNDPLLTAQILGDANACGDREVTQLSVAATALGLGAVHGHVLSAPEAPAALAPLLASSWSLANACATMVRLIAQHGAAGLLTRFDHETLHAVGLLHDLGSMIAFLRFPDAFARASARLDDGAGPFQDLLRVEIGCGSADLGGALAAAWHLPSVLQAAIRYHQHPLRSDAYVDAVSAVHVARCLVRACGFCTGRDRFVEPIDEGALAVLGLRGRDLDQIIDRFFDHMDELEWFEGSFQDTLQHIPRPA
jgi:HD-like signal output (HDOD) protein